jgi:hypothetical protein
LPTSTCVEHNTVGGNGRGEQELASTKGVEMV